MHDEEFNVKVIGAWHAAAADCLQLKSKLAQLEAERDQLSARLQQGPQPDVVAKRPTRDSICQTTFEDSNATLLQQLRQLQIDLSASKSQNEELIKCLAVYENEGQRLQLEKNTLLQEKAQLLNEVETHISHVKNLEMINFNQNKEIDCLKQLRTTYEADRKELLKAQDPSRTITQPEPRNITPYEPYTGTLPTARRTALEQFPPVMPHIANQGISFTRKFLKLMLGGNHQSLIVRIKDSMTDLAMKQHISCFLCPNLEQNPWAPSTPGHHGYMFVGLGIEETTFAIPEVCNLFLGTRQHKSATLECRYLGLYSAHRVDPLTVEEWQTLSHEVKAAYSKTTKDKTNSSQSIAQVTADYDAGQRRVPCVQLKCVGYDEELFLCLLERITGLPTPSVSAKRPHEDDDNGAPGSTSRSRMS